MKSGKIAPMKLTMRLSQGISWCAFILVALYCVTFVNQEFQADAANVAINDKSVEDWLIVDLDGKNTHKPHYENHSVIFENDVSHWPEETYYWQAPEIYHQWKIYTYGGNLQFFISHTVTRGDTYGQYSDGPDLVLEGGSKEHHIKVGNRLPKDEDILRGYDKNQTIKMSLSEPGWYYLVEEADENGKKRLRLSDQVSRADFSLLLAGLDRILIRAKYHMDQVQGDLYEVRMGLHKNTSRTIECDNECSGVQLDDLDDIGLLFDEIRRLAPKLKDGPWRRLAYLEGKAKGLNGTLNKYLKLVADAQRVVDKFGRDFGRETKADLLELKASNLDSHALVVAAEAEKARMMADRLEELIRGLRDEIFKTIKMLNERGFGPGGASPSRIEMLLRESEMILAELQKRTLKGRLDDAERELKRAKELLEKIRMLLIDPAKSAELLKRLEQLKRVLIDFQAIVEEQVLKPSKEADDLVLDAKAKYNAILAMLKEADDRSKESQNSLEEARKMLEITKKCLADEALYLDQLPRQLTELNNSIHEIEVKRSILTQMNPDYQKKYVDKCREHGDALAKKSQELDGLFNATRDVADYALRAANVYKNIADAIDGAEKAAKRAFDAAEKAYKKAVPDFEDSLADRARESKRKSLELLDRARKLRDQEVQKLSIELAKMKQIIDHLFEEMKRMINELDEINAGLKQLAEKNLLEQLQEIDNVLRRLLARINDIHKRLQLMSDLIYKKLLPQYNYLSAGSQSSLGNVSQVIDLARKDLAAAIKYGDSGRASLDLLLKLEAQLDLDLDLLRRKIQLAHQEAGSVHISMMPGSETGVCVRSYFLPSIMSANEGGIPVAGFNVRHLSLIWSLHSEESSSLLLFMASKTGDDFLALEMYERRIRLVYQLGAYKPTGVQVLTHPRLIDINDRGLLNDDAWYLISVTSSLGDRLVLSVVPVPKSNEPDGQQVTQRISLLPGGSSARLTTTIFGEADLHFFVGGLPPDMEFQAPSDLKSRQLTGCLYNLALNEQQVGLWNFKTSQGCEGCMEGAAEERDPSTFSFTGTQSYAIQAQSGQYDRTKYTISMSVKTEEPNGLLFLTISETSSHYLSIFLKQGRIVFLIGKLNQTNVNYLGLSSSPLFNSLTSLNLGQTNNANSSVTQRNQPIEHMIVSNKEYNYNQWFKLTAEKDQNKMVLVVDDELKESIVDDKLLALDMDQVFFGGVWPLLRPKKFVNSSLEFGSFTGCMKDLQIETAPIDLLKRQSYGVEIGCSSSRPKTLLSKMVRVAYPLPVGR